MYLPDSQEADDAAGVFTDDGEDSDADLDVALAGDAAQQSLANLRAAASSTSSSRVAFDAIDPDVVNEIVTAAHSDAPVEPPEPSSSSASRSDPLQDGHMHRAKRDIVPPPCHLRLDLGP